MSKSKMRAVQAAQAGAPFQLVERDIPEPGVALRPAKQN